MRRVTFNGGENAVKAEIGMEVAAKPYDNDLCSLPGKITKITPKGFIDVTWDRNGKPFEARYTAEGVHWRGGYVQHNAYRRDVLVLAEDAREAKARHDRTVAAHRAFQLIRDIDPPPFHASKEHYQAALDEVRKLVADTQAAIDSI